MTKQELADKIDWEGGVFESVEYGLKVSDLPEGVPPEVAEAWANLEKAVRDQDLINAWLWED